jgi:hypothetical protein
MAKSKFFRVAVEGATASDGRTIEKSWLTDIAATYNHATYGARVNLEHIRGFSGDGPFKAYGDILAVRTQEDDIEIGGKVQKRTALYAQIDPTDDLVALTKKRQKIYTSIEVAPDFAKSGKAGLVGLAATDNPASLGTDILAFSAKTGDAAAAAVKASLDGRKQDAANIFSSTLETTIELEPEEAETASLGAQIGSVLKEIFGAAAPKPEIKPEPKAEAAPAADGAALSAVMETSFAKFSDLVEAKLKPISDAVSALRSDHDTLKAELDKTEDRSSKRPPVSGTGGEIIQTDC